MYVVLYTIIGYQFFFSSFLGPSKDGPAKGRRRRDDATQT